MNTPEMRAATAIVNFIQAVKDIGETTVEIQKLADIIAEEMHSKEVRAKFDKIASWLESLEKKSLEMAKSTRFITLREACTAYAKNYQATAKDIRALIAKLEG
jgi:hypothetical protein